MGVLDPLSMDARQFVSLIHGWLMDGRTKEQREELEKVLEGDSGAVSRSLDAAIAESYEEDGMTPLQIEMMERMRHTTDPGERARIRSEIMERARASEPDELS